MVECKICGNQINNHEFIAWEMNLGLGEEFVYIECSKCGCLYIKEVPQNLSKYYPSDYYSFTKRQTTMEDCCC